MTPSSAASRSRPGRTSSSGTPGGNRDPDVFPQPDDVDLDRENIRRHIAFGRGRHHCVGAPLGRAEGVVAFETLLERLPSWRIADDLGGEVFERSYLLRGHRHLWIRW